MRFGFILAAEETNPKPLGQSQSGLGVVAFTAYRKMHNSLRMEGWAVTEGFEFFLEAVLVP
jgi:hypothetical protein